jgi:hypothetical protein
MSTVEPQTSPTDDVTVGDVGDRGRSHPWRRWVARGLTGLAVLLVVGVLVAPSEYGRLTPTGFIRIPVEALVAVTVLLVLPERFRSVAAWVVGIALGLLAIVRILDLGFFAVLDRPFDLVLDWPFLNSGVVFLSHAYGSTGATIAVVAAVMAAGVLLVLTALSVRRLSRVVLRHRVVAARATAALTVVWVACALVGVHVARDVPVAARDYYERLGQVREAVADRQAFAAAAATDAFRATPGSELLTGLRGKDVVLVLIESYGRVAFDDPVLAARIVPLLDAGHRQLAAAGYRSRTGLLTSPTAGGGSWLAQTTLRSGVWVDNQQRYRDLPAAGRLTLNGAFRRAGWRTVGVMPGITEPWPEGPSFGYDHIYASGDLGYRGTRFAFSTMPDQYTMRAFERLERSTPDHPPVMAEIPLVSSHAPWSPVPEFLDWDKLGDGRVYAETTGAGDDPRSVWTRGLERVRSDYGKAIEYSLTTLISYVQRYGDDDLVLVMLGDHQPASVLTGDRASRDVPITIVARDPAVLDRIAGWGWSDGLRPGPDAPVWPMDAVRDRFLTAFGPSGSPAVAAPPGSPR